MVRKMSYIYFNPNPLNLSVGDCTIRAISKVTNMDWKKTYLHLLLQGYYMYDMPSAKSRIRIAVVRIMAAAAAVVMVLFK